MQTPSQTSLKKPALLALGGLLILLAGAVVYFKQRMLFGDASFIAFNIIDLHSFYIQEHRYGSFITQMVPYLGQKFHLPLKAILLCYSISFNLFYLLSGAVLYRLRQYGLVLLLALYYFLFVTESYYWTNNEIHQAVAWMFLAVGVALHRLEGGLKATPFYLLFIPVAFLAVFTHFVVLIPTVFLCIYFALDPRRPALRSRAAGIPALLLLLVIMVKFIMSMNQPYDGRALHGVTHFSLKDVGLTFTTPVVTLFAQRCLTLYWPALLVLAAGITSLLRNRQKKQALWVLLATVGYVIIMGLTYGGYDERFPLYHVESEWASLSIVIAAPFVFSFLPQRSAREAMLWVVCILLVRFVYITASADTFRKRTNFEEHVLAKMREKNIYRLAIYEKDSMRQLMGLDWALSEESLFLSSLEGDTPLRTFRFVNPDDAQTLSQMRGGRPGVSFCFTWLEPQYLDTRYFATDTSAPYTVLSWEELNK